MKEILTKIWSFSKRYMGYIFLGIILIIMFSLTLQKCNDTTELIDEIDLNKYRRELLDSIAKVNHDKTIAVIDSLNFIRQTEASKYDKKVQTLNKEVSALKSELSKFDEPLSTIEECLQVVDIQDSIIVKQEIIITKQDSIAVLHKLTISDLNKKFELEQAEKIRINGMYNDCMTDNEKLIKALNKKDTWWVRNEKWVFLGVGIVGTALILK